jgi:hypothetical protein
MQQLNEPSILRIDKDQACNLSRVPMSIDLNDRTAQGMADEHVRRRDSCRVQKVVKIGSHPRHPARSSGRW